VVARNCLAVERAKKSLGQSTCNPRTAGRVVLSVASFGRRMPPSHRRRWAPGGAPCPPGPHKGAGQWWFRRLGNRSRHVGAEGVAGGTGAGGKSFTAVTQALWVALPSLYQRNDLASEHLWFPKIRSGRIRAVRQNQRIIRCDVCDRPPTWNVCCQPVQVAAPA